MSLKELRNYADYFDLAVSGSKRQLVERILGHVKRDIHVLVRTGAWKYSDWNEFIAEAFGLPARRSYEQIADELAVAHANGTLALRAYVANLSFAPVVADVRDDAALTKDVAGILRVSQKSLRSALDAFHGRSLLATVAALLVEKLHGAQADVDEASETSDAVPSSSALVQAVPAARYDTIVVADNALLANRFRVLRQIGRGGFGVVYEVADERGIYDFRLVAKFAVDAEHEAALLDEVRHAANLPHENICSYFDIHADERFGKFVVMAYRGESLSVRYGDSPASIRETVKIIAQTARALDFAHSRQVVHGDVSPGNILVDAVGHVSLVDFGIAGRLHAVETTHGETRMATKLRGAHKRYSAYEVLSGHPPRTKSDQFSLAQVAVALMQGVRAFENGMHENAYTVRADLDAVLRRALSVRPDERFESCGAFARAFTGAADE